MDRGRVYEINENLGVFVAVADHYFGLIPNRELYGKCRLGEVLKVRVTKVREDGKLDLSLREVAYRQMNADAEAVLARLKEKTAFFRSMTAWSRRLSAANLI